MFPGQDWRGVSDHTGVTGLVSCSTCKKIDWGTCSSSPFQCDTDEVEASVTQCLDEAGVYDAGVKKMVRLQFLTLSRFNRRGLHSEHTFLLNIDGTGLDFTAT